MADCRREAGAVQQQRRQSPGRRLPNWDATTYERNALARCAAHEGQARTNCEARMRSGTVQGSVAAGGVLDVPTLVAALGAQAAQLWHVSNLYNIPQQERLAALLVEHTFADTVFFTNSGTEAAELAIKMARKYHYDKGAAGRTEIVAFDGSFHGRSTGAIAAAGSEKMTKGFGPLMPGFQSLPFGDHDALRAALDGARSAHSFARLATASRGASARSPKAASACSRSRR